MIIAQEPARRLGQHAIEHRRPERVELRRTPGAGVSPFTAGQYQSRISPISISSAARSKRGSVCVVPSGSGDRRAAAVAGADAPAHRRPRARVGAASSRLQRAPNVSVAEILEQQQARVEIGRLRSAARTIQRRVKRLPTATNGRTSSARCAMRL